MAGCALHAHRHGRVGVAPSADLVGESKPRRAGWLARNRAIGVRPAATWRPSHRMATTDRASLAALEAVVAFTTPSNWRSNSCSSAVSCLVGANVTVPCSAAGMSHSRPWKVSTCGTARRAARMSGWILSMETFSCATRPWLVIASQFSPNCAACWTCWRTLFWASEELLRVAVVVARQPQEPLRTIRRGGRAAERRGAGGHRAQQPQPAQESAAAQIGGAQLTVRNRLVQERGHRLVVVMVVLGVLARVPGHLSSSTSCQVDRRPSTVERRPRPRVTPGRHESATFAPTITLAMADLRWRGSAIIKRARGGSGTDWSSLASGSVASDAVGPAIDHAWRPGSLPGTPPGQPQGSRWRCAGARPRWRPAPRWRSGWWPGGATRTRPRARAAAPRPRRWRPQVRT